MVPNVCPKSRAMPNMPLAPPERLVGAEDMIVLLFGVWNNPNPMPHTTSRQIMLMSEDSGVSIDKEKSPAAKITMPILPSIPGWIRSTKYPAVGAVIKVAIGQVVRSRQVINSLCHNVFWRKNGNEIIASICAMKEQMDVLMESVKMGIFSRSNGSNGVVCPNCRRT